MLCPESDIHVGPEACVLLLDGWVPEEEVPLDEAEEQEEEKAPEPEEDMEWVCGVCTLRNPNNLNNCDVCGTIRPPPKKDEI